MKILSFDVGIKNLAYCILNEKKEILNWNIINLIENIEETCHDICGNGNNCTKLSKYYYQKENEIVYICGMHQKKHKLEKIKKIKIYNTKNTPILNICKTLITKLDEIFNNIDFNIVLIENQPCLINPTIKTIQIMIYTYFITRGIIDTNKLNDVRMISAQNKLKTYDGPAIECDIKDKYKKNKYLSIEICKHYLNMESDKLDFLLSHTKKDDLADSYLQGLWYLKKLK